MDVRDVIELIKAITRSFAFLIPTITLCLGLFFGNEAVIDTIVGAIIGSVATAGIFYFKKDEEHYGNENFNFNSRIAKKWKKYMDKKTKPTNSQP